MTVTHFSARHKQRPDVFMIAYEEPNAAENWARLQSLCPTAKLVEGVRGIQAAYRACALAASTPWFFAVDADNYLLDAAAFASTARPAPNDVFVWCALNPINGLNYAHGGIKLFPTALMQQEKAATGIDVTFSIGFRAHRIDQTPSEHRFNTTPYDTWRAAFRETVKLSVDIVKMRQTENAQYLLDVWCGKGAEAPFGAYCLNGAKAGRVFGHTHANDQVTLACINDNEWMRQHFQAHASAPGST